MEVISQKHANSSMFYSYLQNQNNSTLSCFPKAIIILNDSQQWNTDNIAFQVKKGDSKQKCYNSLKVLL